MVYYKICDKFTLAEQFCLTIRVMESHQSKFEKGVAPLSQPKAPRLVGSSS